MTAKTYVSTLVLVMALVWAGSAMACPGESHDHDKMADAPAKTAVAGYSDTRSPEPAHNDGEWSGRWIDNEWTPGYWANGTWNEAEQVDGEWVARVNTNGTWTEFTLDSRWESMNQPMPRTASGNTADLDNERNAEYDQVFSGDPEGRVAGYSDDMRDEHVYMEGDHKTGDHSTKGEYDKDGYHEGARCGKRGHKSHRGHGCGNSCGSCNNDCDCPGAAYDCWGVWHGDENNFAAIRESDYDPVMGRGDTGGSFFGWSGW